MELNLRRSQNDEDRVLQEYPVSLSMHSVQRELGIAQITGSTKDMKVFP